MSILIAFFHLVLNKTFDKLFIRILTDFFSLVFYNFLDTIAIIKFK